MKLFFCRAGAAHAAVGCVVAIFVWPKTGCFIGDRIMHAAVGCMVHWTHSSKAF